MTSTNSVLPLHSIECPDSGGMTCQISQHSFQLSGFIAWGSNHYPNVYLGPLECDTTSSIVKYHPVLKGIHLVPHPVGTEDPFINGGAEDHSDPLPVQLTDLQGREVYRELFPLPGHGSIG